MKFNKQVDTKSIPNMYNKYSLQNNTELVSFRLKDMSLDEDKPRSIRFPQRLWNEIDRDAKKSKRSAVKQMEVVLSMYYGINDVSVDSEKLEAIREIQTGRLTTDVEVKDLESLDSVKRRKTG